MNPTPPAAPVDTVSETEDELIIRAQDALSGCRWTVGECAAKWTQRYAKGRTDADFGTLVGLTPDQVYQRRRVWETFAAVRSEFPLLKWSHFYGALNWDDACFCLQWADETRSTVAEMKAWRRAQRGEDLTTDPLPEDATIQFVSNDESWVQVPGESSGAPFARRPGEGAGGEDDRVLGVARQVDEEAYAPFRQGATSPPPAERGDDSSPAVPDHNQPSTGQLTKRMTSTLERCLKVMTPEFAREFRELPEPVRNRFLKAVGELSSKAGDLL